MQVTKWKLLFLDPTAQIFGLFLSIVLILSALGYLISPDSSSYANNQHLEISMKKPGFSCYFYQDSLRKKTTPLKKMIFGEQRFVKEWAVKSYRISGDSLVMELLDDVEMGGEAFMVRILPSEERNLFLKNHIISKTFWLGTDRFGRDVLSRIIIGSRISLSVGIIGVVISLIVGVLLGALAGYFGGWTDRVILWIINVIWALPSLLLIIAINFALGKGFWQMFIAIGMSMWVEVARVVRGQVLSIKQNEYIYAAQALAFSHTRIIKNHILPNIWGPVIVISAANFSTAILIEAGLSFLGLGVSPPVPSLGGMIRESYMGLFFGYPWLSLFPGIVIIMVVYSLMMLGRRLKEFL